MAEKPVKSTKSAAKPADKPTAKRKHAAEPRTPSHGEISERAYFIHLEGGSDALENWLRAELELTEA